MGFVDVWSLLSEQDKSNISYYIDENAFPSYGDLIGSGRAPLEILLSEWKFQKSNGLLGSMFNGSLILEKEVSYFKDSSEMESEIRNVCRGSAFIHAFDRKFSFEGIPYHEEEKWERMDAIRSLTYPCNLCTNRWHGTSFKMDLPNGKQLAIQSGCKTMKMLQKIAEEFNIEGFEDFRVACSRILNQKTLKGTYCLSIHPLDYMTMSDNMCDWTSCMRWQGDDKGEFRRGTVEMMNSPCVVVGYLKSTSQQLPLDNQAMGGPNVPVWNSKKWRTLFVVSADLISSVKSYPYPNEYLTKIGLDWLRELAKERFNYTYGEVIEFDSRYLRVGPNKEVEFRTYDMYNDFGCSTHYAMINEDENAFEAYQEFYYSGDATCMYCGNRHMNYEHEGMLVCDNCLETYHCEWCGNYMNSSEWDDAMEVQGRRICESCVENDIFKCADCGEWHFYNNEASMFVKIKDKLYYTNNFFNEEYPRCCDCAKKLLNEYGIEVEREAPWSWNNRATEKVFDIENLEKEAFEKIFPDWCYEDKADLISYLERNGRAFKIYKPTPYDVCYKVKCPEVELSFDGFTTYATTDKIQFI